jgi:hypothetical protein
MTPPIRRPDVHTSLGDHEKRLRALERQRLEPASIAQSTVLPHATAWSSNDEPQTITTGTNENLRFHHTDTNDANGDIFAFLFSGTPDPEPDEIVCGAPGTYLAWTSVEWPDVDDISAQTLLENIPQVPVAFSFVAFDYFTSGLLSDDPQLTRHATLLSVHDQFGTLTVNVGSSTNPPPNVPTALDIGKRALTVVRLNDYVTDFVLPEGAGGGGCAGGYCCTTDGNGNYYWDPTSGSGTPACETNPGGSWLCVATRQDGTFSFVGVGGERNGEGITCGPNADWVDPGC